MDNKFSTKAEELNGSPSESQKASKRALGLPLTISPSEWAFETLQHIPDNVFAQDIDGRILFANRSLAISYGYSDIYDLIGKTDLDLFPADTVAALRFLDVRVLATGKPLLDREQELLYADGRWRWIKISRIPLYNKYRKAIGIVCTFRDITDTKNTERLILAQANLLDMIAQSAPLSEICGKIIGIVEDHIPETTGAIQLLSSNPAGLSELVAPKLARGLRQSLEDMQSSLAEVVISVIESGESVIIPNIHLDPAVSRERVTLSKWNIGAVWSIPIISLGGKALGAMTLLSRCVGTPTIVQADLLAMASHMVNAAIERQENTERHKFLASHDPLTRLPNRTMFEELLSAALEKARQTSCRIGLAFFDLDNFKLINDSLGHGAGDILLKTVAERAKISLRPGDVVARLGGDEFVIFLDNLLDPSESIEKRFQHLREAIAAPTDIEGRLVQVTCSMGVAYFPNDADSTTTLLANADLAMYRAKQVGRDNMQVFSLAMQNSTDEKLSLLSALRRSVACGEFLLHYQPLVYLDTGRVFGAEALVRWNHPELGLLYPDDFISIAEETGLIIALGDWVLNAACLQNKRWQEQGLPAIVININVSARQFSGSNLVAQVAAALETSGLDPRYLELELTESLVMQEGAALKMLELEALGVKLAIDDFGTGYSSLSVLKKFPLDHLKIDRSFIRDISTDANDQAITSAIVAMAGSLKKRVIAEGVETSEQIELIRGLGCNEAQGYYFSKPRDLEKFTQLLNEVSNPYHDLSFWRDADNNH